MYNSILRKVRSVLHGQSYCYKTKAPGNNSNPNTQNQASRNHFFKNSPNLCNVSQEDIEHMEADFSNISNFSAVHDRGIQSARKKIDYAETERKYFHKIKNPNMLTWSEKEQIRLLNQNEPEIWTAKKLSESFPATDSIIKKIIFNNWQPTDDERIIKHDESVAANWKSFKAGKLKIPDKQLENHLKKFTTREKIFPFSRDVGEKVSKEEIKLVPNNSEFSQIITNYKAKCSISKNNKIAAEASPTNNPPLERLKLQDGDSDQKFYKKDFRNKRNTLYTLDELRENVKRTNLTPEKKSESDSAFLNSVVGARTSERQTVQISKFGSEDVVKQKIIETTIINNKNLEKYRKTEFTCTKSNKKDYITKVVIPKEKRKCGATYRVKDSYYDENGEFLYRVPGMKTCNLL